MDNTRKTTNRAVIFDLDGTLLDTVVDLGNALNIVFQRYSLPTHDTDHYRKVIGNGLRTFIRKSVNDTSVSDELLETVWRETRSEYARIWHEKTRIFSGIDTLLDTLTEHNIPMAILTNKNYDDTQKMVHDLLGRWHFHCVYGLIDGLPEKPDPHGVFAIVEKTGIPTHDWILVGDQSIDFQTAANAEISFAWAMWGYEKPPSSLYNTYQLHVPGDLLKLIVTD